VALLAGVLLGAGAMVMPGVAPAATPTVSESFSPASVALNGTSTLTFAITNSDPATSPHAVSFDDTLPNGVRVVGTPSSTCTTGLPASAGPSDVGFTDATLTDNPGCTVSATVQGVQAGQWDNPVTVNIDAAGTPVTGSIDVVAPPSISAAFGTALLGLDGATSLTSTITNPNATFALSGIGFTDTLPAGLTIAGRPTNTCGGSFAGDPGSNNFGLNGGQISPDSSCTVSVPIAATITGALTDTTTQVLSAEGGIGNTASAGLTVIGAPTISLLSPVGGRVYAFSQRVRADYSCADDPNGPGIGSCVGDVANGALIDTSKAGAHTFTVTATSRDGGIDTDIAFYTVAPDNRFKLGRPRVGSDGSIAFTVRVPGPGAVTVLEANGSRPFARGHATTRRAGSVRLTVRPNSAGRRAVQQGHVKRVSVTVAFTPRGGTRRFVRLTLKA
jgi:uncharacterized repeat protein (TIGR01451 family)